MEQAAAACREGNLAYISGLTAENLTQLVARTDEDGRTLLHSACTGGSLPLVEHLIQAGAGTAVNSADEEVGWRDCGATCAHHR